MHHICYPTDFSDFSLKSLPMAIHIAKQHDAKLHILHVIPELSSQLLERESIFESWKEFTKTEFNNIHQKISEISDVDASFHCLQGDAADEIHRYCKENNADLVAMSTHGHTGLKRMYLGSVAKKIMHMADYPVMVLNPNDEFKFNANKAEHILLPVSIDHISEEATKTAIDLALTNKAILNILNTLSDNREWVGIYGEAYGEVGIHRSYDAFIKEESERAKETLDKLKNKIENEFPQLTVKIHIESNTAEEDIATFTQQFPDSIVVMRSHVNGFIDRVFLGSTTERVLHTVNAPIFILGVNVKANKLLEMSN